MAHQTLLGYYNLYPRGPGSAEGPLPPGHVMVTRWINEAEARLWMLNGGTYVPPAVGRGGHVSVTGFGAPWIPGTGPIRIDFSFPHAGLQQGGRKDWMFIAQIVANVPVYNVVLHVPNNIPASRIVKSQ